MITKSTSQTQTCDSNGDDGNGDDGNGDDSNNGSISIITMAFIALFAVSFVINILLTTVVTCSKVKAKKKRYTANDA